MHFNLEINFKISNVSIFYPLFHLKSWPTHILIHKREMITLTRNILRIIIATKQKNVFRGSAAVIVVVHISWMLKTETFVQLCSIFRGSINSLWSFPISFQLRMQHESLQLTHGYPNFEGFKKEIITYLNEWPDVRIQYLITKNDKILPSTILTYINFITKNVWIFLNTH